MRRCAIALVLLAAGCSSRETLVVYSPHGPDVQVDYEQMFEAAYPHIDLQWVDMGSQEVYNRIKSERNRPACDVWWGAPTSMFMRAADEGLLAAYTPSWSDRIDEDFKDPEDRWYGTYSTPLSIMFNDREYSRDEVPQTWDDLLDSKWQGKITIRRPPPSGTMRTFIGAMILRQPDEDAGIAWLRRLHAQTLDYMETPILLFDRLRRRPEMITVWIMPDAVLQRERNNAPFGFHVPENTPVLTEGIAIVDGAPHRENAELFYEFVTTVDALVHQAEAYAKIPTRSDIDSERLPAWMTEQAIKPMDIDWAAFADREQGWVDRWTREVFEAQ
jgi:iron(III) transport system substrate-binding protein